MSSRIYPLGISLLCDELGTIQKVTRNDIGIEGLAPGQLLGQVVALNSRGTLLDFMQEMRAQGAVLNCEISFPPAGQALVLHLAGVLENGSLLIAGASTPCDALHLLEEAVEPSPTQTENLRSAVNAHLRSSRLQIEVDESTFDEITRLNNELVTIQRDLVKKNAAMEQLNAEICHLNQELDRRLVERTAQLELANHELAETSFSLAHTLKTPIRAVNNFAYFLQQDHRLSLDEQASEYLDRIRNASLQMDKVTDDLLRLLSITNRDLDIGPVDLSSLARQIMEQDAAISPDRMVEFICPERLILSADPYLMNILLGNLLSNALKFTRGCQPVRIEFGAYQQDNQSVLFVRDNGVGFDMTYSGKLFSNFEKLHPPGKYEGSGIGLSIVRLIAQKHNGQVWAEGKIGQGATFYIALPGTTLAVG